MHMEPWGWAERLSNDIGIQISGLLLATNPQEIDDRRVVADLLGIDVEALESDAGKDIHLPVSIFTTLEPVGPEDRGNISEHLHIEELVVQIGNLVGALLTSDSYRDPDQPNALLLPVKLMNASSWLKEMEEIQGKTTRVVGDVVELVDQLHSIQERGDRAAIVLGGP